MALLESTMATEALLVGVQDNAHGLVLADAHLKGEKRSELEAARSS